MGTRFNYFNSWTLFNLERRTFRRIWELSGRNNVDSIWVCVSISMSRRTIKCSALCR